MLHELKALVGHPISASDGEIGHIRTFLFDDQSWRVRYLVVDVGHWLEGREVVLPTESLERPDWSKKTCSVRLTKEQVRNSPDIDTEKPVSRQQETAMKEYFGALSQWVAIDYGLSSLPAWVEYPAPAGEDQHLRSTSDVLGYEVLIPQGGKARLEGFVLDDDQWHLSYLDLRTESWLNHRSLLIPTRWVDRIFWATHQIFLHRAGASDPSDASDPAEPGAPLQKTT
jgi:hypothetical protein